MTSITVVLSAALSAPPASPERGDTYIVAGGATGVWTGKDYDLATWGGASWSYLTPPSGNIVWDEEAACLRVRAGGAWKAIGTRAPNIPVLTLTPSDPPTQEEVYNVAATVDGVIAALKSSGLMDPAE